MTSIRSSFLLCCLIFFVNNFLVAQTISPVLVSPMGGFNESQGFSLSHSVGEIGIETSTSGDRTLTQGFQQPSDFVVLYTEETLVSSNIINVYPNPFRDQLNLSIKVEENTEFRVHIYDVNGQQMRAPLLLTQGIGQQIYSLDVMDFAQGIYIVRVIEKNGEKVTDFKLIRM